jgi:hypothetical protein
MTDSALKNILFELEKKPDQLVVHFDWDETDPSLNWWSSMSDDTRKAFVLSKLSDAATAYIS